jgi:transposase
MPYPIRPDKIRIDKNTQARVETSEETVQEYVEAMKRGVEFPPILVYVDDETNEIVLADGFHRLAAHMRFRPNDMIMAEQRLGNASKAQWAAVCANQEHGRQRTNEDKRKTVSLAILNPESREMSNREIAKSVGVGHSLVNTVRSEMEQNGQISWVETPMQKAQKALEAPSNEGKSNREIATLIGVAEGTVRNARAAQNDRIGQFTHSNDESRQDSETPSEPIECCGNCINRHKSGACYIDSVVRPEETAGCEDYERLPPEKPEPEVPPPDYENVNVIEPPDQDKTRRRNPNQYQKVKGCINLNLPPDNPQLFAIELRNNFEQEYLTACFAALRHLWDEEDE